MGKNNFKTSSSVIWDKKPAAEWVDAYPVGNGCIGAMIFGDPINDIVSLNHDLLWRRFIKQPTFNTFKTIDEVKELCRQKEYYEAEKVLLTTLANQNTLYINPFVYGFDQYIHLELDEKSVTNYKRYLNFKTATACTEFESAGVLYRKESFCSAEDNVFITHITASLPCKLTGFVSLSRYCDPECVVTGGATFDTVYASGLFEEGVSFAAASRIICRNGRLTGGKKEYGCGTDVSLKKEFGHGFTFSRDEQFNPARGASVCFDTCDEIFIITSLSVDAEEKTPLEFVLKKVCNEFDYDNCYKNHCDKFSSYYNRVLLNISEKSEFDIPTSDLICAARKEKTLPPSLLELAYNMSRYTAISSGMVKSDDSIKAPINLQGIWNRDIRPAWESDYHLDLNVEMCYWPLPAMGLTDLMEPFLQWVERLLPQAKKTAKDIYGCGGAAYNGCCDYNTIGATDVVGVGALGISAWVIQILWIYYEHSPSEKLLKRIYGIMVEIDSFYSEMMEKTECGELSFPFGSSPEMSIVENNHIQWLSSASTFDLTMTNEFYETLKKAAVLLGDKDSADKADNILAHMKKPHIMQDGSLCEWSEEHVENEPGHRHRSPFTAFCPGSLYTQYTAPEITGAMEKLLNRRLSLGNTMSTSFSYSWDAQIFARLSKGDEAYDMLSKLLLIHSLDNLFLAINDWDGKGGGIAWFPDVKVMQVEAQLALASAVCEMFYQDAKGIIRILPALPKSLPYGSIKGITGRYGIKCDISWNDNKLSELKLVSSQNRKIKIILPDYIVSPIIIKNGCRTEYLMADKLIEIETEKDAVYEISC